MEYINTTFAHGNGPYSRIIDLGLAINKELDRRSSEQMPLIMPLVYGDRQKRIIMEDHGDFIRKNPEAILLDSVHGKILNELFFKTGHYEYNLRFLRENQPKLEGQLQDHLSGNLELETFSGEKRNIRREDIALEITHNPRISTGISPSFYTSIAFFSEILEKTKDAGLKFDPNLLVEVAQIAKNIEQSADLHFIPEPSTFSFESRRKRVANEIYTPPFIHPLKNNKKPIAPGMYVTVTGIDGLMGLFDKVGELGQKLYCPSFVDLEQADKSHGPRIVSNPNIKYQFGRTGWSTVWTSLTTRTPLITSPYTEGDDPEIFFNEKTVREFNLAAIFDRSPESVIANAERIKKGLHTMNQWLTRNYGTLDGITYTARIIVSSLLGNSISESRKVEPVFTPKK